LPFPVFSRGAYGQDAAIRSQVVDFRIPIRIGAVLVSPGDLIVGDNDGVVVVPQSVEAQVLAAAFAKVRAENLVLEAIRAGMSSTEAYRQFGVL
jgi:regulator of RNase E activity RraA